MPSAKRLLSSLIFIFAIIVSQQAAAELFRNAYVQFELPSSWKCTAEGTEWVCSSQNKNDSKESIIVLTAKEAGPQDTFEIYEDYLKKPKGVQGPTGKVVNSTVKHVQRRKINDQEWVDSLHLGSEIPGYYTRYLGTIKDKLAILVTLSAHQKSYSKYANDYFRAVESLRVVATKDLLNPKTLVSIKPNGEKLGTANPVGPPPTDDGPPAPDEGGGFGSNPAILGGVFLLLVAGIYLFLRKNKKKS